MGIKKAYFPTIPRLLPIKSKLHHYTGEQIDKIIELLIQEKSPQDIAVELQMTIKPIKKIRWILKNGEQEDLDNLLIAKYTIASIKRYIKYKKVKKLIKNRLTTLKKTKNKEETQSNV